MVPLPIDINIPHMEKFIQTRRSTNEGSSSERHDAKMEEMASSLVTKAAWRILVPRRFRNRHQLRHHGYVFDSNSGCHPPPSPPAPTEIAREHVMGLIPWLLQVLNVLLFVSILLLVSGGSYVLLYRSVMPSMLATVPLHFDYSAEPVVEKSLIATMMTSSPTTNNPLSFARRNNNSKQSRSPPQTPVTPTATVDLLAENGASWEALHEDVAPPLIRQNRLLHARQAYFMEIVLYVPESEHNRRAGLFGLTTHLQSSSSSNHTLLARSTRWTQLPHESGWISVSRKLLCLPAFWIGAMREFRTIPVLAFRHFVESRNHPVRYVTVELQRHSSPQPVVEVLEGELHIGEEFNTWQETLKEWYYTGFFIGTLSFALFYYSMWMYLLFMLQRMGLFRLWYGLEEPDCELDMDFSLGAQFENNDASAREAQWGVHGNDDDAAADVDDEQEEEPRFEDWPDLDPPPTTQRDIPAATGPSSPCPTSEGQSEGEWEDLFYPATDEPAPT